MQTISVREVAAEVPLLDGCPQGGGGDEESVAGHPGRGWEAWESVSDGGALV